MTGTIVFDPLIPWMLLAVVAGLALAGVVLALLRGLGGWALRGLAALVVLGALAGPSYQQEDRAPLSDIVMLVEDESASQDLSDRPEQTSDAADALAAAIAAPLATPTVVSADTTVYGRLNQTVVYRDYGSNDAQTDQQ